LTGVITSSSTAVATASQLAATDDNGQAIVQINTIAVGTTQITAAFDGVVSNPTVVSAIENINRGSVALTPSTTTVEIGRTVQFIGGIEGITNPAFNWSVVSGAGTISSSGLYTAPTTEGTARIRAQYTLDAALVAEAVITITVPATVSVVTMMTSWRSNSAPFANQQLDYFVFTNNDILISSGTSTTNSLGQLELTLPAIYAGQAVLVVVNNLDASMSTAGKVHSQQVITVPSLPE
jgi:hypothetical protein